MTLTICIWPITKVTAVLIEKPITANPGYWTWHGGWTTEPSSLKLSSNPASGVFGAHGGGRSGRSRSEERRVGKEWISRCGTLGDNGGITYRIGKSFLRVESTSDYRNVTRG